MVMDTVGAGGKTYFRLDKRGRRDGRMDWREDHPAGVSPRPWRKMMAAGFVVDEEVEKAAAVPLIFVIVELLLLRNKKRLGMLILMDREERRNRMDVVIGRIWMLRGKISCFFFLSPSLSLSRVIVDTDAYISSLQSLVVPQRCSLGSK